tara:strand:- start:880 stop:1404 length:525 start_codon:yes stop_codon:yes gene_type:complete
MAKIITAVEEDLSVETEAENVSLFLAGGITNCPDWQSELIKSIKHLEPLSIFNPRRKNFPINDPKASEQQITWEYKHLRDSNIIIFWFSKGSLNPIVLYELGRWGNSSEKDIIVGVDDEYTRKQDVIVQTKLSRPYVDIVFKLDDISKILIDWFTPKSEDGDQQIIPENKYLFN